MYLYNTGSNPVACPKLTRGVQVCPAYFYIVMGDLNLNKKMDSQQYRCQKKKIYF